MKLHRFERRQPKRCIRGSQEGLREAARIQLEQRFGPLSDAVLARLASWPAERLDELLREVIGAPSLLALGLEEGNGKTQRRSPESL